MLTATLCVVSDVFMVNLALVLAGTVYITVYPFQWLADLIEVSLDTFTNVHADTGTHTFVHIHTRARSCAHTHTHTHTHTHGIHHMYPAFLKTSCTTQARSPVGFRFVPCLSCIR